MNDKIIGNNVVPREVIDDVLDNFDFDKVYNVMKYIGWTWHNKDLQKQDLIRTARDLLIDVSGEDFGDGGYSSTGGFTARKYLDYNIYGDGIGVWSVELFFILEEQMSCEEYVQERNKP